MNDDQLRAVFMGAVNPNYVNNSPVLFGSNPFTDFFTQTLPTTFTQTLPDALNPVANFLTAIPTTVSNGVNPLTSPLQQAFSSGGVMPDVFVNTVGKTLTGTVPEVFTQTIPDVFTKTIPDALPPVITQTIPDVFTKTIPDVFTHTIPDVFTKTIPDVFTKTLPDIILPSILGPLGGGTQSPSTKPKTTAPTTYAPSNSPYTTTNNSNTVVDMNQLYLIGGGIILFITLIK